MIGNRLRKANLIAKKRFKRKFWNVPEPGCLRKNNTVCSCEMCKNERRSIFSKKTERSTVQERRGPEIKDFDIEQEDIWFDDHYCDSYTDDYDWEEYSKDLEYFMLKDLLDKENNTL